MSESLHTEWKAIWKDDYLKGICIFAVCKKAGTPKPKLTHQGNDIWLEFPFAKEYLDATSPQNAAETSVKTSVKASVKTSADLVLELLEKNPNFTLAQVAKSLGKSTRAIEMASSKLVKAGKLRYVGPQRSGYWEDLKK